MKIGVKAHNNKISYLVCEMLQNASREYLCFELRLQSRRATNTDVILMTEEGEEVTAHQAVLSLHSQLLRTLLQKNRNHEMPKLILCGVSKTVLMAFISLLYCGEVHLNRAGIENLINLLRRLGVDTKHLSFPGFFNPTEAQSCDKVREQKHSETWKQDVKLETDSAGEEPNFKNADLDDDYGDDINHSEDLEVEEEGYNKEESFHINNVDEIKPDPPGKVFVKSLNGSCQKMGGLKKIHWKKKKEEEIQQGIRFPGGKKKHPQKKREPQKERKGKFICPECGIVVTMQKTLKRHIEAIHLGIRYPCDQCPFQARSKISLKHHIEAVHEGKRYYCDQCEFIALTKQDLRKHGNGKHGEKNYHCDQCDYKTKASGTLKKHINAVHLKMKLTCPDCGSKHSQIGALVKHRRLKHGYNTEGRITNRRLAMATVASNDSIEID